ncbi:MAG: hypothetical protein RL236_1923, partial [Pseudomonadota bacterium]
MMLSVINANYLSDYRLHLTFNTGESGDVDLRDLIFKYKVATSLRDIENFKAFK